MKMTPKTKRRARMEVSVKVFGSAGQRLIWQRYLQRAAKALAARAMLRRQTLLRQ